MCVRGVLVNVIWPFVSSALTARPDPWRGHKLLWVAHDLVAEVDERVLPGALGEDVSHVLA